MRIIVDTDKQRIELVGDNSGWEMPLYSKQSLELLSEIWIKVQWNELNWQSLSWMGLPIWQFPEDIIRLQEIIFEVQPDVIVETGVNKGGSSVYFASLCRLNGKGRVISIDVDIPQGVRNAIEDHPLGRNITLIEGDSISPETFESVKKLIAPQENVFVFLDSSHTIEHVSAELDFYHQIVTTDSYIVACDGIMEVLYDTPKGDPSWITNNPSQAAREFAKRHPDFILERPKAKFGDGYVVKKLTYWPDSWLRRVS